MAFAKGYVWHLRICHTNLAILGLFFFLFFFFCLESIVCKRFGWSIYCFACDVNYEFIIWEWLCTDGEVLNVSFNKRFFFFLNFFLFVWNYYCLIGFWWYNLQHFNQGLIQKPFSLYFCNQSSLNLVSALFL